MSPTKQLNFNHIPFRLSPNLNAIIKIIFPDYSHLSYEAGDLKYQKTDPTASSFGSEHINREIYFKIDRTCVSVTIG